MKTEKKSFKNQGAEQVIALFAQAQLRPVYAARYITLARKIASRQRFRLPKDIRRTFCKKCNTPYVAGKTCTIRIQNNKKIITCTCCKAIRRFILR